VLIEFGHPSIGERLGGDRIVPLQLTADLGRRRRHRCARRYSHCELLSRERPKELR